MAIQKGDLEFRTQGLSFLVRALQGREYDDTPFVKLVGACCTALVEAAPSYRFRDEDKQGDELAGQRSFNLL